MINLNLHHSSLTLWPFFLTQPMHNCYTSLIRQKIQLPIFFNFNCCCFALSICYKGLAWLIFKLLHFHGKIFLKSKTGLNRHTAILIPLTLLLCYVNTCDCITTYNGWSDCNIWQQSRYLHTPSLVKEIASVKTKHYRYLVPKKFTHPFYFNKNSNYWHEESVKI